MPWKWYDYLPFPVALLSYVGLAATAVIIWILVPRRFWPQWVHNWSVENYDG